MHQINMTCKCVCEKWPNAKIIITSVLISMPLLLKYDRQQGKFFLHLRSVGMICSNWDSIVLVIWFPWETECHLGNRNSNRHVHNAWQERPEFGVNLSLISSTHGTGTHLMKGVDCIIRSLSVYSSRYFTVAFQLPH